MLIPQGLLANSKNEGRVYYGFADGCSPASASLTPTGHSGTWLPAEVSFSRKETSDPKPLGRRASLQFPDPQVPPLYCQQLWTEQRSLSRTCEIQLLWNTYYSDFQGTTHKLNTSRHWTAAMFPRTFKCFDNHLGGLYEGFAFFGDKNINFGFRRFPFSFHPGILPRNPGLFPQPGVDLCRVIIVRVVLSGLFSLSTDW